MKKLREEWQIGERVCFDDEIYGTRWVVPGYGEVVLANFEKSLFSSNIHFLSISDVREVNTSLSLLVMRLQCAEAVNSLGVSLIVDDKPLRFGEAKLYQTLREVGSTQAFVSAVLKWHLVYQKYLSVSEQIELDREMTVMRFPDLDINDLFVYNSNFIQEWEDMQLMLLPDYDCFGMHFDYDGDILVDQIIVSDFEYGELIGETQVAFCNGGLTDKVVYLLAADIVKRFCGRETSIDLIYFSGHKWFVYMKGYLFVLDKLNYYAGLEGDESYMASVYLSSVDHIISHNYYVIHENIGHLKGGSLHYYLVNGEDDVDFYIDAFHQYLYLVKRRVYKRFLN